MTDDQLRNDVWRYLAGELSLEEFASRLPDGYELDELDLPGVRDLTFRLMGPLGEYDRGDIDESSLRDRLVPYAGWIVSGSHVLPSTLTVRAKATPALSFVAGTALRVESA